MSRRLVVTIALVGEMASTGSAPAQPSGAPAPAAPEAGRAPPSRVLPAEDAPAEASPDTSAAAATGDGGADAAPPSPAVVSSEMVTGERLLDPPSVPSPPVTFLWKPFGYLRAQLGFVRNDPDVAFVGRSDGFGLQNARLGVRGAIYDRLAFVVSIDGAVDERERINVPNGRLRVGLRDAHGDLLLATPAQMAVTLRVGRFEAWFDPDGYDSDTTRAFVDRALESHGVSATEGWETAGLPPGRSMGVAGRWRILGSHDGSPGLRSTAGDGAALAGTALVAEAALMNGADEFASSNDNDSLAASLALRLVAPGRGWAQLAVRRNPRTEGELPFQQAEQDLGVSLGLGLRAGPLQLAAGGVLVRTTFETTGGSSQRAWGAHGQVMWRLLDRILDVGYRFAILDPSSLVVTDRLMEHTLGAVLPLPFERTRAQLNLTHAVEQDGRQLTNDRVEAVLELDL